MQEVLIEDKAHSFMSISILGPHSRMTVTRTYRAIVAISLDARIIPATAQHECFLYNIPGRFREKLGPKEAVPN
jgi:hypothetical protein